MKKHVKPLCLFLSLILLFSSVYFPTSAVDEFEFTTVSGQISPMGVIITKYNGSATNVRIPETINGSKVLEIGNGVFSGNLSLTSVEIPKYVEKLGNSAFEGCSALTEVIMNSTSLFSVGNGCFKNCILLSEFTLPLLDAPITIYSIIGVNAFYNCYALSSLKINAKYLSDCRRWNDNDSPVFDAGANSPDGIDVVFGDEVTYIPANLFYCPAEHYARVKTVTIGKNVAIVGSSAFENCIDLSEVTMNSTALYGVNDNAFRNCSSLTSFTLPKVDSSTEVISYIGICSFWNCQSLESLTINAKKINNCRRWSDNDSSFFDAGAKAPNGIEVVFGDEVSSIPANLFYCTIEHYARVKTVTIGNNVAIVGSSAFENCIDFSELTMNSTALYGIDDYAFKNCLSLTSFTLPKVDSSTEVISYIGICSFWNCQSLESLTINAKKINNCRRWSDNDSSFFDAGAKAPNGIEVVFGDEATLVPANLFYCPVENYARVKKVTLGSEITSVGPSAFENCIDMDDIYFYSKDCSINGNETTIAQQATLYGYSDSTAKLYAEKYDRKFILLPGEEKELLSIEVSVMPDKTDYTVGEILNPTGLLIKAIYNDGSDTIISSGFVCSPTELLQSGIQEIIVSYENQQTDFFVNVNQPNPTTEAPTTEAPTTEAPTTAAPTTEAPTTAAPTTTAPTTASNLPVFGDIDADGRVRANDARLVLRAAAELIFLSSTQIIAADVNHDGEVKANDARLILRYAAGIITSF